MIRILVADGEAQQATHVIDRTCIRIGRDPSNDVPIRDRFVSGRHGELRIGAEGITYEDFCTTNGSRIVRAGQVLAVDSSCGHRMVLREGDELHLGDRRRPIRVTLDLAPARVFGSRGILSPTRVAPQAELDAALGETMCGIPQQMGREPLLALHALTQRLATRLDVDDVISALADGTLGAFPRASNVAVWLTDGASGEFRPAASLGRRGDTGARPLSRTVRDRVLSKGKAIAFTDADEVFDLAESLHASQIRSGLCAPLWDGKRVRGLVQVDCRGVPANGAFGPGDLEALAVFAHQAGMALANARLAESLRKGIEQAVAAIVTAMEARSPESSGHSRAVADLGEATCLGLGLDPAATGLVRRAALLHDAASATASRDHVHAACDSPIAPLTQHALAASRLVEPIEVLADVLPLVRHQHERWDGAGGPDRIGGTAIPLGARILATCDTWDVLRREGLEAPEAALRLRALSGTVLDPGIVEAFTELVADLEPAVLLVRSGQEE